MKNLSECPSRVMQIYCALVNARSALEQWEREAVHAGNEPRWADYPRLRGKQECETLRDQAAWLRDVLIRDRDASLAEDAKRLSPEGVAARAEGIAQGEAA
jgi:hypothetical protein